jgi:hypothetical protein
MAAFHKYYPRAMERGFRVQDADFESDAGQDSNSQEGQSLEQQ